MSQYANEKLYPEEWQLDELVKDAEKIYAPPGALKVSELENMSRDELKDHLEKLAEDIYKQREAMFSEPVMRELEKVVMLRIVDNKWMEHLDHMDMLREGINLRAYGQRAPLVEYKIEALAMFEEMEGAIQDQIATTMYHVAVVQQAPQEDEESEPPQIESKEAEAAIRREQAKVEDRLQTARASHGEDSSPAESRKRPKTADGKKIGRNDPCPCGSGKKYKNCCGRNK